MSYEEREDNLNREIPQVVLRLLVVILFALISIVVTGRLQVNPFFPYLLFAIIFFIIAFKFKPQFWGWAYLFYLITGMVIVMWSMSAMHLTLSGKIILPGELYRDGIPLIIEPSDGNPKSVTTDENGVFKLEDVPPGIFTIKIDDSVVLRGNIPSPFERWFGLEIDTYTIWLWPRGIETETTEPTETTVVDVAGGQEGTEAPPPSPTDEVAIETEEAVPTPTDIPKGVIEIREGEFTMGSDIYGEEKYYAPAHTVYLDKYFIDKYEVTNQQWAECISAGICDEPLYLGEHQPTNWDTEQVEYSDYPVVNVSWENAKEYCEDYANGFLPTEAQWEKAASWGLRSNMKNLYPWGTSTPVMKFANFSNSELSVVTDHEAGVSGYGVFNMAGNAMEWVYDTYQGDYYDDSPLNNPEGPDYASFTKSARGGAFTNAGYSDLWTFARFYYPEETRQEFLGFRCVYNE